MRQRGSPTGSNAFARAFTLIEILVVVVILGVLAAIVTASFIDSTEDAQVRTTRYELWKLQRAVEVFQARNGNALPNVTAGDGTWGEIVGVDGAYLSEPPINAWVGGPNARVISLGAGPDGAYHQDYGWIYDDSTGEIWAASFDGDGNTLPKP